MADTRLAKVSGLMSLSSRSWYSLCRKTSRWYLQNPKKKNHHHHHHYHQNQKKQQLGFPYKGNRQGLGISSEARKTNIELFMDLVDPLEIGGNGLEVDSKPPIAGDREAVLAHHRHHSTSIILKDLQRSN